MAYEPLEDIKFPGIANTFTVPTVDNTLAVQGAAADAKAVGDEISDIKADINKLGARHINRFNKDTVIANHYVTAEKGELLPLNNYNASDFIDISDLSTVKISNVFIACWYDHSKTFISSYVPSPSTALYTLTVPSGGAYMRVTIHNSYLATAQVGENISRENYVPYGPYTIPDAVISTDQVKNASGHGFEESVMSVVDTVYGRDIINRFNKAAISDNKYVNADTGMLVDSNTFFASDYIDISDLSVVACCKTHIIAFYDSNKTYITGQGFNTIESDNKIARPTNAYYMRFSTYKTHLSTAQIGASVTSANYVPYGKYMLDGYMSNDNTIIVDASGNGNYTSLTEALYENVDSGVDIIVKPGTYDLHAEYIEKWGASAVDNMADSDTATFDGFQFGAIIRNRKIVFEAGSFVVCDYTYQSDGVTAQTVNGTHRICAFRVDYNAEIIGLDLAVKHVFYAIHDDYGLLSVPYTNKYENCRIVGTDITNFNCVGGGCKKYSRHILYNCYFNNNHAWGVSVRYHNTDQANATPEVYVSNCYFNTYLNFNWYGSQTTKMKAYANNCEAWSINKKAEVEGSTNDNVELYKWCNTETQSQQT